MGVLLALLGAFAFALMNVFVRNGVRQSDGNTGVLTTMLVSVAVYAVLLAAVIATRGDVRLEAGAVAWFVLAGISATLFGRQTLFGAIRLIGAARGAAIKNATPLVAVGIAILVLGERLTPLAALGIALIIGGLVLLIAEALRTGSPDTRADPVGVALESEAVADAGWWDRTRSMADRTMSAIRVPERRHVVLGVALGVLSALSFGAGHAFRKLGMEILPNALLGATVGTITALTAYLLVAGFRGRAAAELRDSLTTRRPWIWAAGLAGTVGQVSFFAALAVAPVSHVSAVSGSEIVLTVFLAAIVVRRPEAITARVVVPAIFIFAGTALIGFAG
jgi:drug/metabolite transporter (DMT)-like permease